MIKKRQKQALDFIRSHIKKKGYAPSYEEIVKHLGLTSVSTAHYHVKALEALGLLMKGENQPRAINFYKNESLISIPLIGTIAAGEPIEAVEEKETIAVPKSKLPQKGDFYALRVAGNSMINENINDGDIVLVKNQNTAENGQKVVALIDNQEATLKKFYKEKGRIRLQPANNNIEPIILDKSTPIAIQGIVLDVIGNENQDVKTNQKLLDTDEKHSPTQTSLLPQKKIKIAYKPTKDADVVLFQGDRLDLMRQLPNNSIKLIVTSPPYNIGKEYEKRRDLDSYLADQEETIKEAIRILYDDGSIC